MKTLYLVDGCKGKVHHIQALSTTIGRLETNDLVLCNNTVSKLHAVLFFDRESGTAAIRDLRSTNKTWVDEQVIESDSKILHGSKIAIANELFEVHILDALEPEPKAAKNAAP